MPERSLGRRLDAPVDPRNALFPLSLAMRAVAPPTSKAWRSGPYALNQGNLGACVGFAGANFLQNSPTRTTVVNETGFGLYWACKEIDGYAGEGTWDAILMKVLQAQGRISRYLWATSPTEAKQWVLTTGPLLIGVPWYESMFDPGYKGSDLTAPWLNLAGNVVGGHEVLIRGYSRPRDAYRLRNSWGGTWGAKGEAWLARADFDRLVFAEGGDACSAEECTPAV